MVTPFGSSARTTPLDDDYREALISLVQRTLKERWGARRGALNRGVIQLVDVLLDHGDFAFGGRIALDLGTLAKLLKRTEQSVERIIAKFDEIKGLITVCPIQAGKVACNGQPSPAGHFEWELGPTLRALGGKAPELPPLPPRRGRPGLGREPYAVGGAKTLIRMPPKDLASLREMAAANNTSLGGAIVVLLEQHRKIRNLLTLPLAQ